MTMKITRSQLKNLIKEAMLADTPAPPWFDSGYSKFQSDMNEYLKGAGWWLGMSYDWPITSRRDQTIVRDQDIIVILPDDDDDRSDHERAHELQSIIDIGAEQRRWDAPAMNPAVVELEDGSWAIKLNAQMTQDRI